MGVRERRAVIGGFCLLGEIMARFLPVRLPASVWGIVLLFTAFTINLFKPESIQKTADFLLANMSLFFLPPAVAIIDQFDLLKQAVIRFFIVSVLSTIITFLVTYAVVYWVRVFIRIITGKKDEASAGASEELL
jgi:holin-like protein